MSLRAHDKEELMRVVRVYRNEDRTLVYAGAYNNMAGRLEYLTDIGHVVPTCLRVVLDIVAPVYSIQDTGDDDEWTFTKDEWISMTADCPELMELASCVVEG